MKTSPHFTPIPLSGYNLSTQKLDLTGCSQHIIDNKDNFLHSATNLWGIPFQLGPEEGENLIFTSQESVNLNFAPVTAPFLIFVHACEISLPKPDSYGIHSPFKGESPLGEKICDYNFHYTDGSQAIAPIRCRYEIAGIVSDWGEDALLAQPHQRSYAIPTETCEVKAGVKPSSEWGGSQTRVTRGVGPLTYWLYAWENPHPDRPISGISISHTAGKLFLMGITAGHVKTNPLRYSRRQKTILPIQKESQILLDLIDIDLGQIISVVKRPLYDNTHWEKGYNNQQPPVSHNEYIIEYAAHEDAYFYLDDKKLAISDLPTQEIMHVKPAEQPVTLRVTGPEGKPVAVKVHAHGIGGEYLPPRHRHRIPNPYWFEDYSADFVHGPHWCTYIDGTAEYYLPHGEVFFEVSKGFEIQPVRCRVNITSDTHDIEIKLDRVLDWRSLGWVTADTHVHFLSPQTALLEGEAEGVNIVNLLASQWGELFTNIGDFDGKSETASDDYMVRVGTENRQHILGHISLLGYEGGMILPLTTGGPDESALGDPVDITLTQWAKQCRKQFGVNILPHFPYPRGEGAAAIVSDLVDGVEMTSHSNLYAGISPYSLSDWYRYLNCGYHIAAVGGTDKMSADTAVGTIRTYALIDGPLTYTAWKEAVKAGRTFATYGALADFRVEGKRLGETISLKTPGSLEIDWSVASATIPITAVELVVGGHTVDVKRLDHLLGSTEGSFSAKITDSTWIALRIRGHQPGKPEIITAHTSAVMAYVNDTRPMSAPDAATIIEQIEGTTAYIKTMGTMAEDRQYKKALAALTSAHRALHNRMHEMGYYHSHTVVDNHPGH